MKLPGGGTQSEEIAGPFACRQVNNVTRGAANATMTFFYLNSVIDWPFNYKLHGLMKENPSWRLKNRTGHDIGPPGSGGSPSGSASPGGNWLYNLTNDNMRAAWVDTCVSAARAGCSGCFIDQANVAEGIATWPSDSAEVATYRLAHLAALTELDAALAPLSKVRSTQTYYRYITCESFSQFGSLPLTSSARSCPSRRASASTTTSARAPTGPLR